MYKSSVSILLLITFLWTTNCQTRKKPVNNKNVISGIESPKKVITGYNQNFSMMPNMTGAMYKNIQQLKPQMLRYPGGTVTHSWNWQEGVIESRASKSTHPISEIKTLTEVTGATFVFVLDILNKSLKDQITMLKAIEQLGVKINYIELGNELYAQDEYYKEIFPTGKNYAIKVNEWLPELRSNFPNAKIAALLLGRKVKDSNSRMYNWNLQVIENTFYTIDAFTYHIYINENETFEAEKKEFEEVTKKAQTGNKPLWITEYGSNQDKTKPSYYTELAKLADFVESYPNVSIALNHQIVGGTKSKLSDDGSTFLEEGMLFLKRTKK
jgi:hypothetical protein